MMTGTQEDLVGYKVTLLGDAGVGKTSLLTRYISDSFLGETIPTIGIAFNTKQVWKNSSLINLEIWDTAGQERYRSLAPLYYRGSHAILIVYNITDRRSFVNALKWIKDIKEENLEMDTSFLPILILIGNKKDDAEKRQIEFLDAYQQATVQNVFYIEVSAKTGENVEKLFTHVIDQLPEIQLQNREDEGLILTYVDDSGDEGIIRCLHKSCIMS